MRVDEHDASDNVGWDDACMREWNWEGNKPQQINLIRSMEQLICDRLRVRNNITDA